MNPLTIRPPTSTGAAARVRTLVPARLRQLAPSPLMPPFTSLAPYRPTRREFLIGAGGALVLIAAPGCGSGGEGGDKAAGETRTIEHGLGTTEVPEAPERVVAFLSATDVALVVGVEPVAVDDATAQSEYLSDRLDGVETIGAIDQPNLEKIAALEPDLILGLDVVLEQVYDELSQIAPTVGVEFGEASGEWKRYNRGYAEALGKTEEFDEVMADYEQKAQGFREAMGERLGETEVAIMRASPENLRFDLPGIFVGDVVYNDAGLSLPPRLAEYAEENPDEPTAEISTEQFGLAEGSDALFVWNVTGESPEKDEQEIAEITDDPLFRQLGVVRNGNVYTMDDHWFAESVLGADLVLDDLNEYLLEGRP